MLHHFNQDFSRSDVFILADSLRQRVSSKIPSGNSYFSGDSVTLFLSFIYISADIFFAFFLFPCSNQGCATLKWANVLSHNRLCK